MRDAYAVIVIGGGPAGLAAALQAKEDGAGSVLLIERDQELGGILQQCVHPGFGLQFLGRELTGPEYAQHFMERVLAAGVATWLDTMVLEITREKEVVALNPRAGLRIARAEAIVLAMGCRERTRPSLGLPGTRCAGIYTAGTAQRLVNILGHLPGRDCVILGSGDIGLIMARRLTLEGVSVKTVLEIMSFPGGLPRNVVQCLEDFEIPLLLQHTIAEIHGRDRVTGVTIIGVDEARRKIPGTESHLACDTVLISAGLLPEIELTEGIGLAIDPATQGPTINDLMGTSRPGIFACGNVAHVNDLVDQVTTESLTAGRSAAAYALGRQDQGAGEILLRPQNGIRSVVPQRLVVERRGNDRPHLSLRVTHPASLVEIGVYQGETLLDKWRRRYVSPGQTVTVPVGEKMLACPPGTVLEVGCDETG